METVEERSILKLIKNPEINILKGTYNFFFFFLTFLEVLTSQKIIIKIKVLYLYYIPPPPPQKKNLICVGEWKKF